MTSRSLTAPLSVAALLVPLSTLGAQVTSETFDLDRAWFADRTMFVPFEATETQPLSEALAEGLLEEGTALLVFEQEMGNLAFVTQQLAYHHVAQGDIAGEPWMVSF